MLPCTPRSLGRTLRSSSVQSHSPTPPLLFLYPRWFADVSRPHELSTTPQEDSASGVVIAGALDLSRPPEDLHFHGLSGDARSQHHVSRLQDVLQQRVDRLPRSKLKPRSGLEQSLLDRILTSPTFKTARKDIEMMFQEINEQESARRAAHQSRMREVYRPGRIDWVPAAKKLLPIAGTKPKSPTGKVLGFRDDFLRDYAGNAESNMWIHRVGTGAEVHLLPRVESEDSIQKIALHGSPRAVELAEKALWLLQDKHQLSGSRAAKKNMGQGLQRGRIVSVRTFASYVYSLVTHRLPRQAQQETGETHHERVAAALVRLFLDPAASKHASTHALYRALAFTCKYDELEATSDTLYERAGRLGLKVDIDSFNHLIKQAISRNKDTKVKSLVAEMHKTGVAANGQTWVLFLAASRSTQARLAILSLMLQSMPNLSQQEKREFAANMAALRLEEMEDSPKEFSSMLKELDQLFGTDWFNSAVYTQMVRAINRRRHTKLRKISKMLLKLPSNRSIPTNKHIEVLNFAQLRHQQEAEESITDLLDILHQDERPISKMHVAYTFMAAWDRNWPNVCRVLWRHAASHGNIFDTMQSVVNTSLLYNTPPSNNIDHVWRRTAGSIIAGIDTDMTGFDTMFARLSKHCLSLVSPMEWLSVYTPDDGTRDEQISLAYLVLNRDLTAWKRYQPMTNKQLHSLLTSAQQTDLTWRKDKALVTKPMSELLDRAVPVALERRDVVTEPDVRSSPTKEAAQLPPLPLDATKYGDMLLKSPDGSEHPVSPPSEKRPFWIRVDI